MSEPDYYDAARVPAVVGRNLSRRTSRSRLMLGRVATSKRRAGFVADARDMTNIGRPVAYPGFYHGGGSGRA